MESLPKAATRVPAPRRPESVLVVVYTAAGDVLALERCQPFNFWQSVTGSLEVGETAAAAAARELREDTGLDPAGLKATGVSREFVIDARWRHRYADGVLVNTEHEFLLELPARCDITLSASEHSAFQWLSLDAAAARFWSWTNRDAVRALAERWPTSRAPIS